MILLKDLLARLLDIIKGQVFVPEPPIKVPVTSNAPITPITIKVMTNSEKVYTVAKGLIGQRLVLDNASDNYGVFGCAESLNAVWTKCFGHPLGGGLSTALMLSALQDTTRFIEVSFDEAAPGDVIISATGTSTKYPTAHGHVGLMGVRWIMSNSSESGTWEANYVPEGWTQYFAISMGFPTRCFRIKNQ